MTEQVVTLADQNPRPDDGAPASLRALREAAGHAVRDVRAVGDRADDDTALACVLLLDDALTVLATLADVLPSLAARADAGPEVTTYLRDTVGEIAALRARTATASRERDELLVQRGHLESRAAEHGELMKQLIELRRLQRLADVLDDLALQRTVIDDRLAAIRTPVGDAELALERGGTDLLQLSESSLSALEPRVRNVLGKAAAAQTRLGELEAEVRRQDTALAESSARHAELSAQYETRAVEIQAHLLADRVVAAALGPASGADAVGEGLTRARTELDALEARLIEVDAALGRALRDNDQRSTRGPIPWS